MLRLYLEERYYGGCEIVDLVENLAIERVKELFGAAWANVQPHSGSAGQRSSNARMPKSGDKILGFGFITWCY
jgi:glycine hydroxymethyltransferase